MGISRSAIDSIFIRLREVVALLLLKNLLLQVPRTLLAHKSAAMDE